MPATVACPRCKMPLEIPTPAPEKITCASCAAVIKIAGRKPGEETRVPAGESTRVPTGESTFVADRARARTLAPLSHAGPQDVQPPSLPPSTTGLKIGVAATVLLVAGLGCVAAYFIIKDPGNVAAGKEEKKKTPEPEVPQGEESEVIFGKVTLARRDADPGPVDLRVTKAVEGGVNFLRRSIPSIVAREPSTVKDERNDLGAAGLAGLTLLECKVPVDDPDVQALAAYIRGKSNQLVQTYSAAPAILFLSRLHQNKTAPPEDQKLIQTLALRLIKAQMKSGIWGYNAPALSVYSPGMEKEKEKKKKKSLEEKKKNLTTEEALLEELRAGTYKPHGLGGGDLSNTQFAALALWAAKRHGVPVDPALRAAANAIRDAQVKSDGTWSYHLGAAKASHRDSGTCVGLILLALGRAIEPPDKNKKLIEEPAVVAALKHLGKTLHKDFKAPRGKAKAKFTGRPLGADSGGDLYFLWALERMSLILGIETITDVDWHKWGTEIILATQKENGSWLERTAVGPVPDTCFALLFLRQANLFQDLTDKLQDLEAPARSADSARREE